MYDIKRDKPGTLDYRKKQALKALKAAQDVNKFGRAAPDALLAVTLGPESGILERLNSIQGQQYYLGDTLQNLKYAAEGGMIDEENPMPQGEMSLLADESEMYMEPESELTNDEGFFALADVLGPEKFDELSLAIEQFPVVEEVAEMAIQTSDGEVRGPGTGTSDSIPARLSDGEFVFSKEAVDVIGMEVLERMHEEAKAQAAATI